MNVLQQQLRLKRRSICMSECFPAVIACDKRKAFAQGSVATKQSGFLVASRKLDCFASLAMTA
jgi:hypothetical protein